MSTSTLIELFGGFMAACFALWLVIVGIPSPRRVLGTGLAAVLPAVLAYLQGPGRLNIYVLGLVLLYLGGSLALLLNGPGRFSFDAGMVPALLADLGASIDSDAESASPAGAVLVPVPVERNFSNQA
jgi:putative oxidoreductase